MPIGDFLKNLGLDAAAIGNQGLGALGNAMQAQGNPLAFQQAQENQRQHQAFLQQMQMRNTMTPYEQQELQLRKQLSDVQQANFGVQQAQLEQERKTRNQQWLATNLSSGNIVAANAGDPDGMEIEGQRIKAAPPTMINIPPELQSIFGSGKQLPLNKLDAGMFEKLLGKSLANKKIDTSGFMKQVDMMFPMDVKDQTDLNIPQFAPNQPGKIQIAASHNNPGNLKYAGQAGAVPGENGFAKFDSPSSGYAALHDQINKDTIRGLTLSQYIKKYAPPSENDTTTYIAQAMQALGAKADTPLSQIDAERLAQFQVGKESGTTLGTNSDIAANAKFNALYKGQIQSMADNNDETGLRAFMNHLVEAQADFERQYGDKATRAKAKQAGAIQSSRDAASALNTAIQLPDDTLNYWLKQIKRGATNYGDVLSRFDKAGKERFANYVASQGDPLPIALDQTSRTHLANLDAVLDSLKQFKSHIASYQDATPGKEFFQRLGYDFGVGVQDGGLISLGEMDRIRGAAQALTGLRTGFTLLEQGEIHTPNFYKDSGKLMNDKVDNMIGYLENQERKLYRFGAKTGIVQGTPGSISDVAGVGGQAGPPDTKALIQALSNLKPKPKEQPK